MTGFFEWIALRAYKLSGGRVWRLVIILCIFTALASSVLENVTTILLLTPVVLRLCKVMDVSPIPVLMSSVLISSKMEKNKKPKQNKNNAVQKKKGS